MEQNLTVRTLGLSCPERGPVVKKKNANLMAESASPSNFTCVDEVSVTVVRIHNAGKRRLFLFRSWVLVVGWVGVGGVVRG